jgi:uncharacterized protein YodC (DUF2158 family)
MTGEVVRLRRHDIVEGDIVRLKSGGPLMLVGIADGDIDWWLTALWIEGRRLKSGRFDARCLDLIARGHE